MAPNSDKVLSILEDHAALLKKTQINLKKCPKVRFTKGYIQTRIKTIEEYWTTYKEAHHELLKCTTREERAIMSYFVNEEYFIQEDLYLCMLSDLKDMLHQSETKHFDDSEKNTSIEITKNNSVSTLFPRIQMPTFSGNYEDWPEFKDLFESLVHKSSDISDVQKLHYLKTSVRGEAATLIKNLTTTNANYSIASQKLNNRFGNKRSIVNSILKRLFSQRKCTTQSSAQLKALLDTTSDIMTSLKSLNVQTDSWDPIIVFLTVQKLDPETHREWEREAFKDTDTLSTWEELTKFLENTFHQLEAVHPPSTTKTSKERVFHVTTSNPSGKACKLCNNDHILCRCEQFIKMNPTERSEYVKTNNLCFNCLASGHAAIKCRSRASCHTCRRRHHTLLHRHNHADTSLSTSDPLSSTLSNHEPVEDKQVHTMIASYYNAGQKVALLATAVVIAHGEQGHRTFLKALIDSGSQACFISEKATQALKLKRRPVNLTVSGMESMKVNVKHAVTLQVSSRCHSSFDLSLQAYVMTKQLTTTIPATTLIDRKWLHLDNLDLADPNYYKSGPLDLLLGVNEYTAILQQGLIKGPPGTPSAQKTHLGWIIMGGIDIQTNKEVKSLTVMKHEVNIDDLLKTMWEVEQDTSRTHTEEERKCEEIYKTTHRRNEEGRYIVNLPFKTDNQKSIHGNTKDIARNRLFHLERKFKRAPSLKEEYTKVMREYIQLNHMEEIPENERENKETVYLPHHAVVRNDKETSKTRIVFDASAKGTNNVSLNDELLVGPQLQEDLRNLIMRWRMNRICYTCDIKTMYREILVADSDANLFQRILWREDESQPIKEYRLLRVTFGTAAAPYLAIRTLHQVAEDEGKDHPNAARAIKESYYVDDLMEGDDTANKAIDTAREITSILQKGGFTLSKWSSNSYDFLKHIEPSKRSTHAQLNIRIDGIVKALGITWNLGLDQFQYQLNLPPATNIITKRSILSDVQKLFDPLGWIAPCLVIAKILLQKLWLEKAGWDDSISNNLKEEWFQIREDLTNVKEISLERWLGTISTEKHAIQIHGFSDASLQAYSAVAYIRITNKDGTVKTSLIASRTRVAPLRTISCPRLELCGALVLSRLLYQIGKAMRIPTNQMYAWTDSSIVIAWLAGEPHRWKPFVANRVVEINQNLNNNQWYHVDSLDNPADIASRGMLLADLKDNDLWWKGPKWLSEKELTLMNPQVIDTDLERKKDKIKVNLNIENETPKRLTQKFEEFNNLKELIKVITYCRRFLNLRRTNTENENDFTTTDLEISLLKCIKITQEEEFETEIRRVRNHRLLKRESKLKSLNAYLDKDDILRVGGRLQHAYLDNQTKHPIILGANNMLVPLIIADAHDQTLHGGIQVMLCLLRSKYWILNVKRLVKKCIGRCLICAKHRAVARTQMMGDLPKQRVTPSRPFLNSGVDFAGPFQILMSRRRGAKTQKAYIAIFICMSTKAIHLELVGDLTSQAFIAAFKRFVSRRGKCINIWSDQGRNFVGADKELRETLIEAKLSFEGYISNSLALDGTQWHFIPAYSPHHGGLWESGVKSMKFHLKRVLTTNLTFEEMTTVLCQVEACLNSRPLYPIDTTDPDSIEPLTPGHFLIGEAPVTVPTNDYQDHKMHTLSRWQYTQKLVGDIWRRWQIEYLSRLQQRPKWLKKVEEFKIGDIVLIKVDGLPPGKWSLGRVVDKHPGHDGITRVYSIKSGENVTKRPITKLCYLPIETD